MVNRDALTQPQRHRGTEAIISAGPTHIIQRRAVEKLITNTKYLGIIDTKCKLSIW
jgi:hypothetical protein